MRTMGGSRPIMHTSNVGRTRLKSKKAGQDENKYPTTTTGNGSLWMDFMKKYFHNFSNINCHEMTKREKKLWLFLKLDLFLPLFF